ncbi:MAG: SWIM zinc finger family protein [Opitutaceae bacterium]|nr:SWIM zinc finger family protein [Opitutaceae bacterium]
MSWYREWRPYQSVAERRAKAAAHARKMGKSGVAMAPVTIAGRTIASTFWGQAWCRHLESFSDFSNRLPRGRSYVRNGSVLDLQIAPGNIKAQVMGSSLYQGTIGITPLNPKKWKAIKAECAGKIDSLVELLQGRLSDAVMRVITDREKGLFPLPSEIKLECSCPDWASLCKHLAAVLYGVGARLDTQPELLFKLRGVDHLELISAAAEATVLTPGLTGADSLDDSQLSSVFGIDIASLDKVDNEATPPLKASPEAVKAPAAKGKSARRSRGKKAKPTKVSSTAGTKRKAAQRVGKYKPRSK